MEFDVCLVHDGADQGQGWEEPAVLPGCTSPGPLNSLLTLPWEWLSQERKWASARACDTGGPALFLPWAGSSWANQILCW